MHKLISVHARAESTDKNLNTKIPTKDFAYSHTTQNNRAKTDWLFPMMTGQVYDREPNLNPITKRTLSKNMS